MRRIQRGSVVVPLVILLVTGCDSTTPTSSPSSSATPPSSAGPTATQTATASDQASPDSPAANPSVQPSDPWLGALVVTVTDRLRVRSAPEVSDASIRYEPLLPLGTELHVIGGPVTASGYSWYDVRPVSFPLAGGVEHGWVAMADHDGTPWLALADAPIAGLETASSSVSRAKADPAAARTAARSATAFGLDLYRAMLAEPTLGLARDNLVFSPTSIALALGMARAGAGTRTASQVDAVLHSKGWSDLGPGLNSLDQALAARDGGYVDDEGHVHQLALRIANASFGQRGWRIEPTYLDAIAAAFGAGLQLVDYIADPEAARKATNAWVSQKTADRIPQLLQPPDVSITTRLYLVNAIYLKANWLVEFRQDRTAPSPFVRLDGSRASVPTMHLDGGQEVPYVRGDGWRATELRYRGPENGAPLAMTLILPDDLAAFESALTAKQLDRIAASLAVERTRLRESVEPNGEDGCGTYPYSLDLSIPRFQLETRAQLRQVLADLGMPLAFDPVRADFSGIHVPESHEGPIHIANVIHQANIDVDELGTEAAAATAIGVDTGGCTGPSPARHLTLRLDHPFLFALRDLETGAVLFLGRVVDPTLPAE